jgi:hypothetical protein
MGKKLCMKCEESVIDRRISMCWDCFYNKNPEHRGTIRQKYEQLFCRTCGIDVPEYAKNHKCDDCNNGVPPLTEKSKTLTKEEYAKLEYEVNPINEWRDIVDKALDEKDIETFMEYSDKISKYMKETGFLV